jgi:hypothetical protein
VIGSNSLGIVAGRFAEAGISLLGVCPVRMVPAGGSWIGLNHGKLGVPRLAGDLVIVQ